MMKERCEDSEGGVRFGPQSFPLLIFSSCDFLLGVYIIRSYQDLGLAKVARREIKCYVAFQGRVRRQNKHIT
jgi:hypothetical protein